MSEMVSENKFNEKVKKFGNKISNFFKYFYEEYIKFPAYIISHPLKGYDLFKREKKAKMSVAIGFIILMIITQVLSYQYSGFLVNDKDINDLNTLTQIAYIVSPIILFVVANWSITTLMDGKGKANEIFMMTCYSLFPLIVSGLFGIILSNILTLDEIALYNLVMGLGRFLTGYMIFMGLISIHEYGLGKVLVTIILTFIALMVILFMLLLSFDLFQKMFGFIYTIYREITLRLM